MAGTWDGFTAEDIKKLSKPAEVTQSSKLNKKIPKMKYKSHVKEKPSTENINSLPEETLPQNPSKDVLIPESHDNGQVSGETLEQFHARQRLLEEQNRQRKDFLAKVLSDRKKQTTEEAKRLQQIQDELHKLDVLLSDDVAILRDQIEVASKEFGEAQKRFSRAEKEFLEAKQNLFAKVERKELLTKHLCTIIEQNELRKAKKLSELMGKLAIDACPPTTVEIDESGPVDNASQSSAKRAET